MQKKILKRKILLALCLGSMVTIQPAYAATTEIGYSVPGDNVTVSASEISITKTVADSIAVTGVSNIGYSNFILSNSLTTITAGAKSTSASAYGINNYEYIGGDGATTNISGDAVITITASGGSATSTSTNVFAFANANAEGINNYSDGGSTITSISGDAAITVAATGGSATHTSTSAYAVAIANATGYGIYNHNYDDGATTNINGDATITVTATGGRTTSTNENANAYTEVSADAYGIDNSGSSATTSISGDAAITVTATGGNATATASYAEAEASASAYGISNAGTGATTDISGDAVITVTATGGSATSTSTDAIVDASAYGISNSGTGTVSLGKNATIMATANNGNAYAYSLHATDGTININQVVGNPYTVKLTGDVLATGGIIKLNLNNSSSFLRGNVVTSGSGTVNLTLSNNAVWQPVYDNRNGTITYNSNLYSATLNTINALNLSGGIVNLTWDDAIRTSSYRNLSITTLSGTGGTFTINTDVANNTGDIITIGTLSSASKLKVAVNYDSSLAKITQPTILYSSSYTPISVTSGGSNLTVTGVTTDSGVYSLTPNFSGTTLTSLAIGASSNTKAAASSASGQAELMQTSVNHLRKRLGDLRDAPATETGVWARIYSGEVSNDKYTSIESAYKGMQMGYDKSNQVKGGRTYTGGAVSYTEADNSFYRGSGEIKDCDLALYQTWIGNDGHYYDLIAKHGRLSSDYHVTDLSDNYSTADYHTRTSSLSAEYGYRKQLKDGWYLEPQVELTYGHINGVEYATSAGMSVKQDGIDRLTGRLGLGLGKKLNNGSNLYTSLSVLHEFNGDENIKADTLTYSQDMGGTWYEFILGASDKLSNHSTGYVNVEKLFGGYVGSDWQFNAGCRWNF